MNDELNVIEVFPDNQSYEIPHPDIPLNLLLMGLYNASKQQGMGLLSLAGKSDLTPDQAQAILDGTDNYKGTYYFDYLNGRVLKIEIGGKTLNTKMYDRDNGENAVKNVITELYAREANFFELCDKVLSGTAHKYERDEYEKLLKKFPSFQSIVDSWDRHIKEL